MRRAIREHLVDFALIATIFVVGVAVAGVILSNQRLRFPLLEEKPFDVKVELPDAQAVQPGQGQTVRTAGVRIGEIGAVKLEDGKAVVTLELDRKYKGYIRRDATVLLRTKTGLKDMFVEVDPGTGKPIPEGGRVPVSNTAPDIDPDEILSALDTDTRDYLKLLVSGAGKGLKGRGSDLRETFARLGPLNRDLNKVAASVARRRRNLARLVNRYGLLTQELGTKDKDIVRLVRSSNSVFEALASQDPQISDAVRRLPPALRQTQSTLAKVDTLGARLRPALESLRPPIRRLPTANRAVLPLVREATPEVKNQIRPFARIARPYTRDLGVAGRDLAKAAPALTVSVDKLNRLLNIGAFNPGGAQGLTGNPRTDRDRQEGYLYWLGWLGQNTTSLFSTADAQGPVRRIALGGVNCSIFTGAGIPAVVVNGLGAAGLCTP
jgi:phospholipid/cholesterol/gamma-HCH transport system substrate-binding protein